MTNPTPEDMLNQLNSLIELERFAEIDSFEFLKNELKFFRQKYFIVCSECEGSGEARYCSNPDALMHDDFLDTAVGNLEITSCPDCIGKGFNFPWALVDDY
jgi:hypothetical protein